MVGTKCDTEYRNTREFWIPSGRSIGEIQDGVLTKMVERDMLPRSYNDNNFTRTFTVKDVVPIFYPGMADYELYVDIKVDDLDGRTVALQQEVYLGAYVKDKIRRKIVPLGVEYYDDTHKEISDLLMSLVNK
mgnify:CR=1 FL=1